MSLSSLKSLIYLYKYITEIQYKIPQNAVKCKKHDNGGIIYGMPKL